MEDMMLLLNEAEKISHQRRSYLPIKLVDRRIVLATLIIPHTRKYAARIWLAENPRDFMNSEKLDIFLSSSD